MVLSILLGVESAQNGVDRSCSRVLRKGRETKDRVGQLRAPPSPPDLARAEATGLPARAAGIQATKEPRRKEKAHHIAVGTVSQKSAVRTSRSCERLAWEETGDSQERCSASKDHAILSRATRRIARVSGRRSKSRRVSADRLLVSGPQKQESVRTFPRPRRGLSARSCTGETSVAISAGRLRWNEKQKELSNNACERGACQPGGSEI